MCRFSVWFIAVALVACARSDRAWSADDYAIGLADAQRLIETYCYDCHQGDDAERGVDLAAATGTADTWQHREVWEKVARQLHVHAMPPDDAEQPTEVERAEIVAWIAAEVMRPHPNEPDGPGRAPLRRLTRQEYYNTLGDLLGVEIDPSSPLPAEGGGGEGFSNSADTLVLSPVLLEKYFATADEALAQTMVDPDARARLLQVTFSSTVESRQAARDALTEFARRAWRRPPTANEIDGLMDRFIAEPSANQPSDDNLYERQTLDGMKAILVSPSFLYRVEETRDTSQPFRVSDFELATRLSYFLWSTMPDEELLQLASKQQLSDAKVLMTQVRRMLADDKSRSLAVTFGSEWLGYGDLGTEYHPWKTSGFTGSLAKAMRQETELFVTNLFRENRSILDLLDSDYTFANEELAQLYGIEGVTGSKMRKIALTDRQRGGVITMASILTITSYPNRTSPVLRGRWVMNQILGSPPPPPPPSAPDLARGKEVETLSMRERLARHRKDTQCAACHDQMDPIGLALENYDLIGRWRTKDEQGHTIDASGILPTGESFAGPAELKALLLTRRERFARHVSEKMLAYALGRGIEKTDFSAVYEITEAVKQHDYQVHALIEAIVSSVPFQYRGGDVTIGGERP